MCTLPSDKLSQLEHYYAQFHMSVDRLCLHCWKQGEGRAEQQVTPLSGAPPGEAHQLDCNWLCTCGATTACDFTRGVQ